MRRSPIETQSTVQERAILVTVEMKAKEQPEEAVQHSLEELRSLAETAGVETVETVVQYRDSIDAAWYIGKGKVEEIRMLKEMHEANVIIFNQELSGAQVRNLESAIDAKIIDRTQLILDIFAQRAKTREGKLQVELAQLQYLLPRLAGHYKNLSRLGGGIGTRGPGETQLETDRRHIQRRIRDLKEQIEEVKRHRQLHRTKRRRSGVTQLALVGYTNAGKSTLLNRLTKADVLAEDNLFATLDPTSRRLTLPNGLDLVLTDTVGFIQNLPHDLVAAFRATLEEVNEADIILHVVDSSSPMRDQQMAVVEEVLAELGAQGKDRIVIFNKIDLLTPEEQDTLIAKDPWMRISAYSDEDLERVVQYLQDRLEEEEHLYRIPIIRGDLIAKIYRIGGVVRQEEEEAEAESILLRVSARSSILAQVARELEDYRVE
ncbi:GTPase HflX [Insulibacter thermoxylanivorax]|uniref:GTPase HflX n=1 Tax=Insulibacter thermoxylanivorax TaxID=2749268 RepID=A0A916VFG7_9BACL|nr:GTPase HflX [Insulibacter thermoxylanivorax]GFR38287.1 GTPase HflX [Insulibacter thermoxylanivorax]